MILIIPISVRCLSKDVGFFPAAMLCINVDSSRRCIALRFNISLQLDPLSSLLGWAS